MLATSILGNYNLTHTVDWDTFDLASFKQAHDKNTIHMSHFITEYMSNTFTDMKILQQLGHATTNL